MEVRDLWHPEADALGRRFARCRIDPSEAVPERAAPDSIRLEVRSENGNRLAFGNGPGRATGSHARTVESYHHR
jgi:hypothetical protein